MANIPSSSDLQREIDEFKQAFSVVFLATCDGNGLPEASHAPFVIDEVGRISVFISELAKHTQNLRSNPQASLLMLETEKEGTNAFALRRLQFGCSAEFIVDDGCREVILALLNNRFGKFIATLSALRDFNVVRFTPEHGKFVRGFAQTFQLSGQGLRDVEMYRAKEQ